MGLDPKHDLIDEHVIALNIATIFGNVKKFKTTNPLLSPNARKEIETLYWNIYGTRHIINIGLMAWFVKGWITEWNGQPINWATTVAKIGKEKARHLGTVNKFKYEKSNFSEGFHRSHELLVVGNELGSWEGVQLWRMQPHL